MPLVKAIAADAEQIEADESQLRRHPDLKQEINTALQRVWRVGVKGAREVARLALERLERLGWDVREA